MRFTTLSIASLLAASGSAMPAAPAALTARDTVPDGTRFNLMALRSASEVHFATVSAAKSGLHLKLPNQGATCDKPENIATFYIQNGEMYLHAASATPQQLFVDRSGMGQGIWGYTTGAQPTPRNGERTAFAVSNDDYLPRLNFNGVGFIACPNGLDGAWRLWADAGIQNPGASEGCLGVTLILLPVEEPNSCLYTS